jgi:regulator of sigma E protease
MTTVLAFVVAIAVLVVFHELGHYVVARWFDVKVLRFSFGFGKVLYARRFEGGETEWAISAIPLGGYVKMLDEREGDVGAHELSRAFNRQSVGKRSLIVAAGPLANFALAILLYWAVFLFGSEELLPVLGTPPEGTPAAMAGIANGERVKAVDGQPVETWNDFRWILLKNAVDRSSIELEVEGVQQNVSGHRLYLDQIAENGWEGDALEKLGIRFYRPLVPPLVGKVMDAGAGARAGLREGDRILAIDGKAIRYWHEVVEAVREAPGRAMHFEIERAGQDLRIDVLPEVVAQGGRNAGRIGVMVADAPDLHRELKAVVRYGLFEAAIKSLQETWDKSVFSLVMMGKMLTGEVSWKNLSGPVTIADYAGQSARLGLDYYVKFMAMVSISLGVLNLLPIPVLDGGHLMYHMIEVVRRRPLSERAAVIGQQIGMSILFALMAFAFFNDLNRLFGG